MTAHQDSRKFELSLLLIFALSGCAGLIYQSVWASYLGNFLGHAAYAQTLVLAIFMGGMAIGAWAVGQRTDAIGDPLRAYALVELAIGVLGLMFHPIYVAISSLSFDSVIPALGSSAAIQAYKWTTATILILPESILLGMTFPLMSAGIIRRHRGHDGGTLAGLYFTNSLGAALGALLATFWLVPSFGLPGTVRCAGVLNVMVAVAAWYCASHDVLARDRVDATPVQEADARLQRLILVAAALTGASSFVYEIGWVRMLNLALGSSVHSFELMLSAFIGGLALGGWLIRKRIDRFGDAVNVAGYVQVAMGVAALASLAFYAGAFEWVSWMMRVLSRDAGAYVLFNLGSSTLAMLIMVPTALFAGMTLPLLTLALLRNGSGERSIGVAYAANTLGAIGGVFIAVHLLIPELGLKLAMVAAAAVDIGVGVALLRARPRERARIGPNATIALAALAVLGTLAFVRFDPLRMASGVFRSGSSRLPSDYRVLYQRDGKTATVSFVMNPEGTGFLSTNGKPDAAIALDQRRPATPDEYTMGLLGLLPISIHPSPKRIGIVGFGSGMTTHTVLGDDRVESVDTIEIEPNMVVGAHGFGEHVDRAFSDPRSHIRIEDAKTFFSSRKDKYDVIISEPSNPWVSGVGGLFSEEFYGFVPRHLEHNGVFVQWLQLYEIDMPLVASVIKAMGKNFAHFSVYEADVGDCVIVASNDPLPLRPDAAVFKQAGLAPLFERLRLRSVEDLRVRWVGDERTLIPVANMFALRANSDYYPVLAYSAPATRFQGVNAGQLTEFARTPAQTVPWISGIDWPAASQLSTSGTETGMRILAANEVIEAVLDPAAANLLTAPTSLRQAFDSLMGSTKRCKIEQERETIGLALQAIAEVVVPFGGASRQHAIWSDSPMSKCLRTDPKLVARLDLYEAMGTRDASRMYVVGKAILEHALYGDDRAFAAYAMEASMLGALLTSQYADVQGLLREWSEKLRPDGATSFRAAYILALSDAASKHEAVAQLREPR